LVKNTRRRKEESLKPCRGGFFPCQRNCKNVFDDGEKKAADEKVLIPPSREGGIESKREKTNNKEKRLLISEKERG